MPKRVEGRREAASGLLPTAFVASRVRLSAVDVLDAEMGALIGLDLDRVDTVIAP